MKSNVYSACLAILFFLFFGMSCKKKGTEPETEPQIISLDGGVIAHHGHSSEVAFSSLRFSKADVAALTNLGGPCPFIHAAACQTGSFDRSGGDCLAKAFMKAGIVDQPSGAIAFLDATTSMDPLACCFAQREAFINLYYTDDEQMIGELCYNATLYAMNNLDSDSAKHLYKR